LVKLSAFFTLQNMQILHILPRVVASQKWEVRRDQNGTGYFSEGSGLPEKPPV
jgi:hypothetical protein